MKHPFATCALLAALAASSPALAAAPASRDALFFRLYAADAPLATRDQDAPVIAALVEAAEQALRLGKKAGYNQLYEATKAVMNAHLSEVPMGFFYGLQVARNLAWYNAHNRPPFKYYDDGRQVLVQAIRFAQENQQTLLGEDGGVFRGVLRMSRLLLAGMDQRGTGWVYRDLREAFTENPDLVPNPNALAALDAVDRAANGHASSGVWDAVAHVFQTLETEDPDTTRYFEIALETCDRISNHFDAAWTTVHFLAAARTVPNAWGAPLAEGLVDAAHTYDEYGWIKYPIGSEEPFRRQARRVARFLAEGHEGFPALAAMLQERTADGKYYLFQHWTMSRVLLALPVELVPAELRNQLRALKANGSFDEMRAFLDQVAAGAR